jgi:glucosamine 6-phosphate synthetase-like amidotransferase/phosphosugar isomerase protein
MSKNVGYFYWGFLGDKKFNIKLKEVSTPDGNAFYSWSILKDLLDKTLNGAHEAYARGAKIVLVTQFNIPEDKLKDIFVKINLQDFGDDLMPISSIGVFQLISYLTSIKKGINPDQPRNLAKSVTVE